jgi:GNAT superfamily N-acetyltransferase
MLAMTAVVQLVKDLSDEPRACELAGIRLRHFAGVQDIAPWLHVRHRAFGRLPVGVRAWSVEDFDQEFTAKPWWRPSRMWLAESTGAAALGELIGTATLALRGVGHHAKPVVHWLAVLPSWRRRGVATLLMDTLEAAAWQEGHREIWLETHVKWTAAAAFYTARGYRKALPAGEPG